MSLIGMVFAVVRPVDLMEPALVMLAATTSTVAGFAGMAACVALMGRALGGRDGWLRGGWWLMALSCSAYAIGSTLAFVVVSGGT
ncbi:MAG: hypothetical protein H6734_27575 [Alphaproteobacteria bacterium]|nr:hypothetical protein [Alphaproteobacteria bacterium]